MLNRLNTLLIIFATILPIAAQTQVDADFANLIRTPADLQRTLERCDGHPDFETALVNWLEIAEPSSREERYAVRQAALRLLEDTSDRQLVLGLNDGLLRHALEDVKRDAAVAPGVLARSLYADIWRAVGDQRYKASALAIQAHELRAVKDERQASFVAAFLKLTEPRVARVDKPAQSRPGDAVRNGQEQSDQRQRLLRP